MSFILRVTPYLVLILTKKNYLVSVLALYKITGLVHVVSQLLTKKKKKSKLMAPIILGHMTQEKIELQI